MQRHKLLLNLAFTSTTEASVSSSLVVVNGYEVNNVQGLGGGITNETNIKGFLNSALNLIIANDFFEYLTQVTTPQEFVEIFRSDKKLSNVFNDFYQKTIIDNTSPSQSVIDESLSGTQEVTITNNTNYNWSGEAIPYSLSAIPLSIISSSRTSGSINILNTSTEEESYYIPVFITNNTGQADRQTFKVCDDIENLILNPPEGFVPPAVEVIETPPSLALPGSLPGVGTVIGGVSPSAVLLLGAGSSVASGVVAGGPSTSFVITTS